MLELHRLELGELLFGKSCNRNRTEPIVPGRFVENDGYRRNENNSWQSGHSSVISSV